jgi:hypothetical protein
MSKQLSVAIKLIEQYRAEIRNRSDLLADGFCQGAWFEDTYQSLLSPKQPSTALRLEGQRFGMLTVLSRSENDRHRKACWLCKCDCGGLTVAPGTKLKQGKILSCGCYRAGQWLRRCGAKGRRRAAAERELTLEPIWPRASRARV